MEKLAVSLEDVRSFLNITWQDTARDERLKGYIKSSSLFLNGVAGEVIDFEDDLLARELLLNRVLYLDNQALNDFGANYNRELNELRIRYDTKQK